MGSVNLPSFEKSLRRAQQSVRDAEDLMARAQELVQQSRIAVARCDQSVSLIRRRRKLIAQTSEQNSQ
jgi:hypothetical protein